MDDSVSVPAEDLLRVARAQLRLSTAIEGLDDATARRASALPDWTVGHVLTHLARNADSHRRRSDAAARGETIEQYPGGYAGRAREIDAGAGRTAAELLDDVVVTGDLLAKTWPSLPASAWGVTSLDVGGRERPLRELPSRRWQELEVHLVDLHVGVSHRDWSDDFVGVWLPRLRLSLTSRLPPGAHAPEPGVLAERDELAWLYGRLLREDLPTLAPWA